MRPPAHLSPSGHSRFSPFGHFVPHLLFASDQSRPHRFSGAGGDGTVMGSGGGKGGTGGPGGGHAGRPPAQLSPSGHSSFVPPGHGVPGQDAAAAPQLTPHRFVFGGGAGVASGAGGGQGGRLPWQVSPSGHSPFVPNGHGVPGQESAAAPQLAPQRFVLTGRGGDGDGHSGRPPWQPSPPGHSSSVPSGHGVPHDAAAEAQSTPHRLVFGGDASVRAMSVQGLHHTVQVVVPSGGEEESELM